MRTCVYIWCGMQVVMLRTCSLATAACSCSARVLVNYLRRHAYLYRMYTYTRTHTFILIHAWLKNSYGYIHRIHHAIGNSTSLKKVLNAQCVHAPPEAEVSGTKAQTRGRTTTGDASNAQQFLHPIAQSTFEFEPAYCAQSP